MTTSAILKLAKRELDTRGWCQHALVTPDGRVCVMGAFGFTANVVPRMADAQDALRLFMRVAMGREYQLAEWNDRPERTLADVSAAFEAAIAIAEQQEAGQAIPVPC